MRRIKTLYLKNNLLHILGTSCLFILCLSDISLADTSFFENTNLTFESNESILSEADSTSYKGQSLDITKFRINISFKYEAYKTNINSISTFISNLVNSYLTTSIAARAPPYFLI